MQTSIEDDEPKRFALHVEGPKGWTQTFDEADVDLLVRLGFIKFSHVTSSRDWETRFYVPA